MRRNKNCRRVRACVSPIAAKHTSGDARVGCFFDELLSPRARASFARACDAPVSTDVSVSLTSTSSLFEKPLIDFTLLAPLFVGTIRSVCVCVCVFEVLCVWLQKRRKAIDTCDDDDDDDEETQSIDRQGGYDVWRRSINQSIDQPSTRRRRRLDL